MNENETENPQQAPPEDEQSPVAAPLEHADLCHTADGHAVPDGCTDESGAPLAPK